MNISNNIDFNYMIFEEEKIISDIYITNKLDKIINYLNCTNQNDDHINKIKYLIFENLVANNENEIIAELLEKLKFDYNYLIDGEKTIIHLLSENGINLKNIILDVELNINLQDNEGETIFHKLCKNNDIKNLRILLTSKKLKYNILDNKGYTPMMSAVKKGNIDILDLLYKHQYNIKNQIKTNKTSILHIACKNNDLKMIERIFTGKYFKTSNKISKLCILFDENKKIPSDYTDNNEIKKYLLFGEEKHLSGKLLEISINGSKNIMILELIIKNLDKINLDKKCKLKKWNYLQWIFYNSNHELLLYLINYFEKYYNNPILYNNYIQNIINLKDKYENNILHLICTNKNTEEHDKEIIIKLLLENFYCKNLMNEKNIYNLNPFNIATSATLKILQKYKNKYIGSTIKPCKK